MADKVYTSAEFKRERDNFHVSIMMHTVPDLGVFLRILLSVIGWFFSFFKNYILYSIKFFYSTCKDNTVVILFMSTCEVFIFQNTSCKPVHISSFVQLRVSAVSLFHYIRFAFYLFLWTSINWVVSLSLSPSIFGSFSLYRVVWNCSVRKVAKKFFF